MSIIPSIETCDYGHRFGFLPDHPRKDGLKRCPHCMAIGLDALLSERGDILEIIRHNESVDDNGDPVGAKPETSWEEGYAAGIRCLYRFLKGVPNAAPQPTVAAPELRAGSAALKTCATSAADESSPHGTAHHDNQSLPQATDEWKGPYVQPNSSGSISSDKQDLLADLKRIGEFLPHEPNDTETSEWHHWIELDEAYSRVAMALESLPSAKTPIADLSAFMVTHNVDVDFCYPGNHGGPVDEWLVTLTNQSANRVEEFVGRTLDEAITYAVTKYVQDKG